MSYSNLKIDRTKIISTVYEKCTIEGYENYLIGSMENIDGIRYRLDVEVEGKKFFLDFFFNKNYKTTIQTGQGSHVDLQEMFAKHIYGDHTLYIDNYVEVNKEYEQLLSADKKSNDTIVYKKLDDNIYEQLITIVKDEECCERCDMIRDEEAVTIYKLFDKNENEVTITHFSSTHGHTIMIQGRPKMLFAICVAEMAELIGKEENMVALNAFYGTNTTLEEIEKEFNEMFINSKAFMSTKLKKCICQALQNRRDLEDKFDPTYLAAPAQRALEGHIRVALAGLLTGHNINVFDVVEKDSNGDPLKYKLQKAHWHSLGNNKHKIESIGKAYTYMSLVRNKLQHWDNPNLLGIDTTRVLSSSEVDKTIMDALKLIEEYYS